MGLFVAVIAVGQWHSRKEFTRDFLTIGGVPLQAALILSGACLLATQVGPYTYHLYFVVFEYVTSKFPYTFVREFQA